MSDGAPDRPGGRDEERATVDAPRAVELTGERAAVAGPPSRQGIRRARARRTMRRRRRWAALMILVGILLIAAAAWRWWSLASESSAWGPVPAPPVITIA